MFERFTDRAKQAVTIAQDEAMTLGHDFIGTGHLLLGLFRTTDGIAHDVLLAQDVTVRRVRAEVLRLLTAAGAPADGGQAAVDALTSLGFDVDDIRRRADDSFGPGRFKFPRPPFTPRLKRTMELTLREATGMGHTHIGPEHLLLGALDDPESTAVGALTALDVDVADLRIAVLTRMAPQRS